FFSSRRRHTISKRDWSSDVCSSDLSEYTILRQQHRFFHHRDGLSRRVLKPYVSPRFHRLNASDHQMMYIPIPCPLHHLKSNDSGKKFYVSYVSQISPTLLSP